jgi:hypothetical protein
MLGANGICVPKQRVISLDRTLSGKEVKFNTQASIHTIYLGFEEKDILGVIIFGSIQFLLKQNSQTGKIKKKTETEPKPG